MKPVSEVRGFILSQVANQAKTVSKLVAERFGITRQAANRHLARMVEEGLLTAEGQTRNREYRLRVLASVRDVVPVTAQLQEDVVWSERILPLLSSVPENVRDICNYGFTEMVNNVRDHSGSPTMTFTAEVTAVRIEMRVVDEGVGIFRKIKDALALEDERHAVFELTKGKLTTDPERHTGEGIFFTSRMFDAFSLGSGSLSLVHLREMKDFLIDDAEEIKGTYVGMDIDCASTHTTKEVFDRYATEQDDYAFQRTHVVVDLARVEGEKLISRSQAKRILARLERFREVVLDFDRIEAIGPAFADEIFRVFRSSHPSVRIVPLNANAEVQKMIRRGGGPGAVE